MKKYAATALIATITLLIGIFAGMTISEKDQSDRKSTRSSMRNQTRSPASESQADRSKINNFELALGKPLATFEDKIQYFKDASDYLGRGLRPMGFEAALNSDLKLAAAAMSQSELARALYEMKGYKISSSAKSWLRSILIIEFTDKNPVAALNFIFTHQDDPQIGSQKMLALRRWMEKDPDAANHWLNEHDAVLSLYEQATLRSDHIVKLCKNDFPEAMEQLKALHSIERSQLISRLQYTLPHEPEKRNEIIKYLMTLEDKTPLINTGITFIRSITDRNPQEGLKFLETWPGGKRYRLQNALAQSWASSDPKAAADWLLNQPSAQPKDAPSSIGTRYYEADRNGALGQIFSQWTSHDSEGAMQWLSEQKGINADPFYGATSGHHATYGNLTEAFKWAAKIDDDTTRSRKYGDLINRWSTQDLDGLKKWLDEQPAAMRQKLTKGTMVGHLYAAPE